MRFVQSIERSLHLIYKSRFSIKQYQFKKIDLNFYATWFKDDCGYTFMVHSPFGWLVHVFMVGHDWERRRNAKGVANKDET